MGRTTSILRGRNNASTITSQLVDTTLVILILFYDDPAVSRGDIYAMIWDGWLFKTVCAFVDTPLAYGAVALFRRHLVPAPADVDA